MMPEVEPGLNKAKLKVDVTLLVCVDFAFVSLPLDCVSSLLSLLSQGRVAQLEAELARQKKYSDELKGSQDGKTDNTAKLATVLN